MKTKNKKIKAFAVVLMIFIIQVNKINRRNTVLHRFFDKMEIQINLAERENKQASNKTLEVSIDKFLFQINK